MYLYAADTFIEMRPPKGDLPYLKNMSQAIYDRKNGWRYEYLYHTGLGFYSLRMTPQGVNAIGMVSNDNSLVVPYVAHRLQCHGLGMAIDKAYVGPITVPALCWRMLRLQCRLVPVPEIDGSR